MLDDVSLSIPTLWCSTTFNLRRFGHADRIRRQSSAICCRFVAWFRLELLILFATFLNHVSETRKKLL